MVEVLEVSIVLLTYPPCSYEVLRKFAGHMISVMERPAHLYTEELRHASETITVKGIVSCF